MEDEATIFFRLRLSVLQRKFICEKVTQVGASTKPFDLLFKFFFSSNEKLTVFFKSLGVLKFFGKPLCDLHLGLIGRQSNAEYEEIEALEGIRIGSEDATPPSKKEKGPVFEPAASQKLCNNLLCQGIELFK